MVADEERGRIDEVGIGDVAVRAWAVRDLEAEVEVGRSGEHGGGAERADVVRCQMSIEAERVETGCARRAGP